jgi:Tfp pilus assembly protein PilO
VCVIAGLFLSDFVLCGYLPSHQRLTSLLQAREHQQSMIRMAAAQGAELPNLRTRLRDTEAIVDRYEACVPADKALAAFLQRITAVMAEHALSDPVVLPGKEQETGDLGCIPIEMTCEGALTNLFDFFNTVRTLDRMVRIESVTLENDGEFTGMLTMRAQACIFYQLKSSKTTGAVSAGPVRRTGNDA